MKYTAFIILLLFSLNAFSQFSPVTKNASPEAKKLLAYLYSSNGNQTLTGQHTYPPNFDYEQKDYNELVDLAKGKLITLGECGELPKPGILKVQPRFTWFKVWGGFIKFDNPPGRVKEIYDLPQVITHDEV